MRQSKEQPIPDSKTTIQITTDLDTRIKRLAGKRADRLGLSKALAKGSYLEMLITEEEYRVEGKKIPSREYHE